MAITDAITTADLDKVLKVQFVSKFEKNLNGLMTVLGINDVMTIPNGYAIDVYKTTGTLKSGKVGELEEVPLSKYDRKIVKTIKATFGKWRQETSEEAITDHGYEEAVSNTNASMLEDIQNTIREDFFTVLATGTGTCTSQGEGIKGAIASLEGELWDAASKGNFTSSDLIFFANPKDVASYLATTDNYNRERVAGWNALKDFLGVGTVVLDHNVPAGTVYGTYVRNLRAYAVDLNGLNFGTEVDFHMDASGRVGIAHEPDRSFGGYMTHYRSGVQFVPEFLDLIFKTTVNPIKTASLAGEPVAVKTEK